MIRQNKTKRIYFFTPSGRTSEFAVHQINKKKGHKRNTMARITKDNIVPPQAYNHNYKIKSLKEITNGKLIIVHFFFLFFFLVFLILLNIIITTAIIVTSASGRLVSITRS